MSNPLDPIFDSYLDMKSAIKVVKRCSVLDSIDERRPFGHTRFEGRPKQDILIQLGEVDGEIKDLIILSLYAAFERRLRDHIIHSGHLLNSAGPPTSLGPALSNWFTEMIDEFRMDVIAGWFCPPVQQTTISKIAQIRKYRHWVAHGRNVNDQPESVTPTEAYKVLTTFLQEAGLI